MSNRSAFDIKFNRQGFMLYLISKDAYLVFALSVYPLVADMTLLPIFVSINRH